MSADETMEALLRGLEAALRAEPENGDENNRPRAAVLPALEAVMVFLRDKGIETRLRAPLLHLHAALTDANEGRGNPILQSAPQDFAKPRKPVFDREQMAMASAAVDILHDEAKVPTDQALARMAKAVRVEKSVLRDYRKNLRRDRAPAEALESYKFWQDLRRSMKGTPAETIVSHWIEKGSALAKKE